jgi:hypothetical protein
MHFAHNTKLHLLQSFHLFVLIRFEAKLPEIFKDVHEAYEQIDARLKAEQFKVQFHSDAHI